MSKGQVLLVDDDDLVLQSLSLSLEDAEFAVATATSGQEAIALCRDQPFEVVVCDIRMPQMNGIETLGHIKEIQPEVRTIVITGYADDPEAPVQAIRLGVDDYLLKPFDDELLHHSVAQNVERFRLQRENASLYDLIARAIHYNGPGRDNLDFWAHGQAYATGHEGNLGDPGHTSPSYR